MERALTAPSKSKELHEVGSGVGLPTLIRAKPVRYQYVRKIDWRRERSSIYSS